MWGETAMQNNSLKSTKIIIQPVTRTTARTTVDTLFSMSTTCPELFVEHGDEEYYSIIK